MIQSWTPDQLKAELDKGSTVFLKIWKEGCGACKLSEPAVERLYQAHHQQMSFAQISASEYPEILELSGSEVLPTFFTFKEQKLVGQVIGFKGIAKLQAIVDLVAT